MKTFNSIFNNLLFSIYNRYRLSIKPRVCFFKQKLYSKWISKQMKEVKGINFFIRGTMYLFGGKYITIGENFGCGRNLTLECFDSYGEHKFSPKVIIHNRVSIMNDCHIGAINEIIIEDDVLIGSKVFISDHSHGKSTFEDLQIAPDERKLYSKGKVVIKKNVWIGEGVAILPNVTIGENCIVGANSVVTKSFPANCIIAGNPAKIIKEITNPTQN